MHTHHHLSVALGVAAGRVALAQIVEPAIQMSAVAAPGDRNGEPVIVASPLSSDEVLVAWISLPASSPGMIAYRVTTDAFQSPFAPTPPVLPPPNTVVGQCGPCTTDEWQADPAVARSWTTGHLYLGAVFFRQTGIPDKQYTLGIARKQLFAVDLDRNASNEVIVRYATPCGSGVPDRPSLAVGPKPPETLSPPYLASETAYFTWYGMSAARSVADAQMASVWECTLGNPGYPGPITSGPGGTQRTGWPNPGVVLHSGARAGRLIVTSCEGNAPQSPSPPEITWTDRGGDPPNPWAQFQSLNLYDVTNAEVVGIVVPGSGVPVPPDVRGQFKNAPSIATDPNDPSHVYVAFMGRPVTAPDEIDLFVAWTNTGNEVQGGPVFQSGTPNTQPWSPSSQTYHIPDASLLAPGDPPSGYQEEQFHPALVIDALGGINLLYCQVLQSDPDYAVSQVTVRYARWPSRAALAAGEPPFLQVLAPASTPWPAPAGHDYQSITSSGCMAYAAWAGTPASGTSTSAGSSCRASRTRTTTA